MFRRKYDAGTWPPSARGAIELLARFQRHAGHGRRAEGSRDLPRGHRRWPDARPEWL